MKKLLLSMMLTLVGFSCCIAQQNNGSRLSAMGNNCTAINDVWNIAANVAAINNINKPTLAISYLKYSFDKEISTQGLVAAFPFNKTAIGFSLLRYGLTAYNEISGGISVTKKFGQHLSIGIKGNYHQLKISNYGMAKNYSLSVGLFYQINPQFALGFYATNLFKQNYIYQNIATQIPSTVQFGASYRASNKVLLATNISKTNNENVNFGLGLEYELITNIFLRTGLNLKPFKQYAGVGFNHKTLNIDLSITNDKNLGYTPQITLGYAF